MVSSTLLPSAEESKLRLNALYGPIGRDLQISEKIFAEELGSRYEFVQTLVDHAVSLRGKQLRPALLFLTAQACGGVSPSHHILAAVVEMIHTATLVHDDILDESQVRRHSQTVNAAWGNETAVLLGDYLFTHAFHLAASLETTLACRWIGHATNLVCEGEMMQVHHRGNLDLDESSYFEIIEGKTAVLTAVACRLGAHFAGASEVKVAAMEAYGRDLGVAFQIADDVLDLLGDEKTSGKTLGTDLEKQKLTLPLIHLLENGSPDEVRRIRALVADGSDGVRHTLRSLLEASGSLDYAWQKAEEFADSARARAASLPPSPAREILMNLARYVVRRSF